MRARLAAHTMHARGLTNVKAANEAREARWLERAGGDPVRAEHLRRAHYQRLALKSSQARAAKRSAAVPNLVA